MDGWMDGVFTLAQSTHVSLFKTLKKEIHRLLYTPLCCRKVIYLMSTSDRLRMFSINEQNHFSI